MKKNIFLIVFICLKAHNCFSQTTIDLYNTAKSQYENGDYSYSIKNLKTVEQYVGQSPKTQSLLVYNYVAQKDYINAAISINIFKKLIGYKRNDAIQAVLNLESEINQGVAVVQKNFQTQLQKKRMAEAQQIVNQQVSLNKSKIQSLTQKFNQAKNQTISSADAQSIAQTLKSAKSDEKDDLLKTLRESKKIKRSYKVQFSNAKLNEIVKLIFEEYNANGDVIKYLSKDYGDKDNLYIEFGDYPQFNESVISTTYINNLIAQKDFSYFKTVSIKNLPNKGSLKSILHEEFAVENTKNDTKTYKNLVYRWQNIYGKIVKDSTIYGNSPTTSYVNSYFDKIHYRYIYEKGRLYRIDKTNITKTGNSTKYSTQATTYNKTKEVFNYTRTVINNNLGDVIKISTQDSYPSITDCTLNYDTYGRISFTNEKSRGTYNNKSLYFYNFYEYQDGYFTGLKEYNSLKKYNESKSKTTYNKDELKNIFINALKNNKEKNYGEAKRLLELCIASDPNNPEYDIQLAWLYYNVVGFKTGLNKAQKILDQALEINPSYSPVYVAKADIYHKNGYNKELAISNYKTAADWGSIYAVKKLAQYGIKYKPDELLFSKENQGEIYEANAGIYLDVLSKVSFSRLTQYKKTLFVKLGNSIAATNTASTGEFKQSNKNPNVYLFSKNPEFRLIFSKEKYVYCYPTGHTVYALTDNKL